MFPNFELFTTDLELAQESLFIIDYSYNFFLKNPNHPLFHKDDEFFNANLKAHKISVIINLHKVFDEHSNVYSIKYLMDWLYKNKGEFTKTQLIARKGEEYAASKNFEGVEEEQFQRLFEIKRDLQKTYNKEVKPLRDEAFAHRTTDILKIQSAAYQLMEYLANGAAGIYNDIWQAYHNGEAFSFDAKPYAYHRKISDPMERFFLLYQ